MVEVSRGGFTFWAGGSPGESSVAGSEEVQIQVCVIGQNALKLLWATEMTGNGHVTQKQTISPY